MPLAPIQLVPEFEGNEAEAVVVSRLYTILFNRYGVGAQANFATMGAVRQLLNQKTPDGYVIDNGEDQASFRSKLNDYHIFLPQYPTLDGGEHDTDFDELDTYDGGAAATDYGSLDTLEGGLRP